MPAEPAGAMHGLRADQRTLLRAVAALLPDSEQLTPAPISLSTGNHVTLLHDPDPPGHAIRVALSELLRGAGVRLELISPPPAFGKIGRPARTNLVIAASWNPTVRTAARRCGCRWTAPVLTANDHHPHDVPLRLVMRTTPAVCVELPGLAPDVATEAVRLRGPISWSHRPGAPVRRSTDLTLQPGSGDMTITYGADGDSPRTLRTPGPVVVAPPHRGSAEIDGELHHLPSERIMLVRLSLPLYVLEAHSAPAPGR